MSIIDGKALSAAIREDLKKQVVEMKSRGLVPGLAVILVGDDPASAVYVRNKALACEELGMYSVVHKLPAETTKEDLVALVHQCNQDKALTAYGSAAAAAS